LPEACENEFVRTAAAEVEKREAERAKEAAAVAAKKKEAEARAAAQQKKQQPPKPVKPAPVEDDEDVKVVPDKNTEKAAEKPAEKPAADRKPAKAQDDEPFKSVPLKEENVKTGEFDLPFFNANGDKKTRHNNLQFGKNK